MEKSIWAYKKSIYDDENEVGLGYESEILFKVTYESTRHLCDHEFMWPREPKGDWWTHELMEIKPILVNPCLPDVHAKDVEPVKFAELTEEQSKKVAELCEKKKDELIGEFLDHGAHSEVSIYWMD